MSDGFTYLGLFAVGCVVGVLNVVAGGGSFLTLPILIFLGLPASVANGTNRVAILLQNMGAVFSFHQHGLVDWRAVIWAALPAMAGAPIGTWMALTISDQSFQKVLAFLMIAVTLSTLWNPFNPTLAESLNPSRFRRPLLGLGFFVVGIYGGFVQAGVGFLILAVTTLAGLNLVRGNAVKVLSVLLFTSISLGLFIWQDKVHWPMGLALAAGTFLGGLLGVKLTVLQGHAWIRGVVTVAVLGFAAKLWMGT